MFFDTHAHYDDARFDDDRDALLGQLLPASGAELIVNCGCDRASSLRSIAFAEQYPYVYAAVGSHPQDCECMTDDDLALFEQLASHPKVVAIGEIGLDYHYDYPRELQQRRFIQQLELAARLHMPVILHERDAHGDMLDIVRRYAGQVTGVFHCYSGALDMAKELVKLGWYLGFNGAITFKNARKAPEVLEWVPMQRILLETDCPYLAPEPHRGHRNDSRNIPLVAARIAAIRGLSAEEIMQICMQNGKALFRIP